MKTIRKRRMRRRAREKDLQDIPPGYPSQILCLTKRSNPKSISWHFQSKQWTHSLKHTHTFMHLFLEPSQHFFTPVKKWKACALIWVGRSWKSAMHVLREREQQHNPNRLNTLVVTEQQVHQRNNMFTWQSSTANSFQQHFNYVYTLPNRVASLK